MQHPIKMMKKAIIALGILCADVGQRRQFINLEKMIKSWASETAVINAVEWSDHVDMMIQSINVGIHDHINNVPGDHTKAPTTA